MSRYGLHDPLIPITALEAPRDGRGRPLSATEVPHLHRPVMVSEPEPIPSAPVTPEVRRERRPIVCRPDRETPSKPVAKSTPPLGERLAALRVLLPATAQACATARPDLWSFARDSAGRRRLHLDLGAVGAVRGSDGVWTIPTTTTSSHPAPAPRSVDSPTGEPCAFDCAESRGESVDCRSQVSAVPALDAAAASEPIPTEESNAALLVSGLPQADQHGKGERTAPAAGAGRVAIARAAEPAQPVSGDRREAPREEPRREREPSEEPTLTEHAQDTVLQASKHVAGEPTGRRRKRPTSVHLSLSAATADLLAEIFENLARALRGGGR